MDPPKQLGWYSEHGRAPTGEFSRSLGSFGVRGGFCTYQGPRRRVATTERLSSRGRYGPWLAEAPGALTSGVALRLFCVPPVGMGGAAFHPWVKHLPRSVELLSVELPGRGFRLSEAMTAKSLPQLARDVLDGIGRETFVDLPFVLFGHSFGAWLAYEMLQELLRRAWPRPLKLYVSANRAVSLSGSEHDPDQVQPELAQLGADRFWQHFERRYGINPDLQHSYVRDHVRGILQNDFTLLENYIPSTLEQLPVPLCALCAKGAKAKTKTKHPPDLPSHMEAEGMTPGVMVLLDRLAGVLVHY
ncbi:Gramicidin S biosynthesis protein GrsT [Durusdinium trenchii]|uniref:Gramicidin S biosynthesis protein GrsT n=1 Tax=Durusdinium trenchii TaxID=1381693 RepID=A0ABP0R905_9DINO